MRNIDDFAQELAAASAWRKTELKRLARSFDLQYRRTRRADPIDQQKFEDYFQYLNEGGTAHSIPVSAMGKRALYTITYSHWEGYVKQAIRIYLKNLAYISMSEGAKHPRMMKRLTLWRLDSHRVKAGKILDYSEEAVRELRAGFELYSDDDFRISLSKSDIKKLSDTKSNLNLRNLSDLFKQLDIELSSFFDGSNKPILYCMVEIRNGIAHGDPEFRDKDLPGELKDGLPKTIEFVLEAFSEVQETLIRKAETTFQQ